MAGTEIPRIYIESAPIIDMAKHKANLIMNADPTVQAHRENNVWFCVRLLEAARDGHLQIFSSALSVTECTQIQEGVPVPPEEIMTFFNELLCSGKSGILLVQPIQSILMAARNLKWSDGVNLRPMDSIHVATAKHMKCSEFLTTDGRIYANRGKLALSSMKIIQASQTQILPDKYRQDRFF